MEYLKVLINSMERRFLLDIPEFAKVKGNIKCQKRHMIKILTLINVSTQYEIKQFYKESFMSVRDCEGDECNLSFSLDIMMFYVSRMKLYNIGFDFIPIRCVPCGKITLKKCGCCKRSYYCSRECQVEDWKEHKLECKYSKN
jgi:hypothetical protein